MKQTMKRGLAFLMALIMCLSLLPVLHLTAEAAGVDYQYGTGSYSHVIKNWGTRGTTADFLSPKAEAFYAETTYEELMAYQGGTGTSDAYTSDLYKVLQDLMADAHTNVQSYQGTREYYRFTDCVNNDSTKISSFYSGTLLDSTWDGTTYNREHCWPNSKSLHDKAQDSADIMMLRASDSRENFSRGNTAYGESSSYYDPNDVSNGQYNLHGDVARTILYGYVRWGNTGYMWGSSGVMESLDVLLRWMEEDPVDTWEMGRNDSIESITGTRNVFVDYPELAFVLFGAEIPTDMDTPSGEAVDSGYTITAVSNNTEYGTVSLNGRNITATPADGCRAMGYTILSGTATVTRNGNVFSVSADSDCTVQIDFAPAEYTAVSFVEDGVTTSTTSEKIDEPITMPAYSGEVTDGFTFLGWVTESMKRTDSKPATIYKAGDSYTVSEDVTFHALFSMIQGIGGTGKWELVTDTADLSAGTKVIIAASDYNYAISTTQNNNNRGVAAITKNPDKTISFAEDAKVAVFELKAGTVSDTYAFYDAVNSGYLYAASSGDNHLKTKTTLDVHGSFQITVANGVATVKATQSSNRNWMRYNSSSVLFSCYSSGQNDICLYAQDGDSKTIYTTSTAECTHENSHDAAAVAPTCTEAGYTAGVYCDDCLSYISGHEKRDALGHSYGSVLAGDTITYTCEVCEDTYHEKYYPVVFSVPEGLTAPATVNGASGIELPAADAPEGWTFLGWAEEIVDNETDEPSYFEAGDPFTAKNADILYALYSENSGGTSATQYVLTDLADIKPTDTVVITMKYGTTVYALYNGNGTGSAPTAVTVTVTGNALAAEPADTLKWNVSGNSSGYTFYVAGSTAKWLYCTSTNNGVRVGTNSNKTFVLDSASGYLKHVGTSRYLGVYLTNPDWRCYTNTTGNTKNQTLGFYVKSASSTSTTYTTVFEGSCAHEDVGYVDYKAPTCTEPGRQAGMACNDCETVLTGGEVIPATGHSSSYVDNGDGTHDYVCDTCQTVETDNEAHSFVNGTCVCGAVESTGGEMQEEFRFKGVSMQLGSSIALNFAALESVLSQYEDVYVVFQAEGKSDVTVTEFYTSEVDGVARRSFSYTGLNALDMALEVSATLYGTKDGQLCQSSTVSYSILKFCDYALEKDTKDAAVCANLLLYGQAAMDRAGSIDEMLTQVIAEHQEKITEYDYAPKALAPQKSSNVQQGSQITFSGQRLEMSNQIALMPVISFAGYTGSMDAVTFQVAYTDIDGKAQIKEYTAADLAADPDQEKTYWLSFAEFYSTQMTEKATFTIFVDGQEHASYTTSIENYCAATAANESAEEKMKTLAERIWLYGCAAKATYAVA